MASRCTAAVQRLRFMVVLYLGMLLLVGVTGVASATADPSTSTTWSTGDYNAALNSPVRGKPVTRVREVAPAASTRSVGSSRVTLTPPRSAGVAAEGATDRVVIGKIADITVPGALGPGERTLLEQLPKLSTEEAQWAQNERVLLQEMKSGNPIRDASIDSFGNLANDTGYLSRERATLLREGWTYDFSTALWSPGG